MGQWPMLSLHSRQQQHVIANCHRVGEGNIDSNCDLERDLFIEYPRHFNSSLASGLSGDLHETVTLQNRDIVLDILEVASEHFRKLVK
jgi:hypothetical protein